MFWISWTSEVMLISNQTPAVISCIHRLMSKMAEEYKNSEVTWVAWQKGGHCAEWQVVPG